MFLGPFKNLLPTIGNAESLLEMSVLVAILFYAPLGWAVGRFVAIVSYRNVTVARRSRSPRGF